MADRYELQDGETDEGLLRRMERDNAGDNPGVLPGGICADGDAPDGVPWSVHNVRTYRYSCPRDHFLYGPSDMTFYKLAKLWGIRHETIYRWANAGGWKQLRIEHQANTPANLGGTQVTSDLEAIKSMLVQRELDSYFEAIDIVEERLRQDTEDEITKDGDVVEIRKKAHSDKASVSALRDLYDGARTAVGLHTKLAPNAPVANVNVQINEIVERRPAPEATADYRRRMRAELVAPAEAIEGEVADAA